MRIAGETLASVYRTDKFGSAGEARATSLGSGPIDLR